jgi:osmotically-inducible protein OsmY
MMAMPVQLLGRIPVTLSRLLIALVGALFLSMRITAASADPTSDAALAEAVKAELVKHDPEFLGPGQVEVHDGVVTLKGQVLRPRSLYKAVEVSRSVPGVKRVVNRAVLLQ